MSTLQLIVCFVCKLTVVGVSERRWLRLCYVARGCCEVVLEPALSIRRPWKHGIEWATEPTFFKLISTTFMHI